jgi:thiol-disulfide isomerase/thioredoxin
VILPCLGEPVRTAKQIYAGQTRVKELTDRNLWNIFYDRSKVVVVAFWADWCRPCDGVAGVMTSIADRYSKGPFAQLVKFYHVQWDEGVNPRLYERFGFKSIPVVFFYHTTTGRPPTSTAPLLEASLGADKRQYDAAEYIWRIEEILRKHGHFVRIVLIDLAGYFKNNDGLRNQFISKLEAKFNNLAPDWLKQQQLAFRVEYRSNEPTAREKESFSKLDFPVYLLGQQHGYGSVRELMEQHQIPRTIKCVGVKEAADPYELAEECWNGEGERGCGIPPGEGFRKVGFIKTHKVAADPVGSRDLAQAFLNVTAHEIGHMFNICIHTTQGMMKYPVPPNVDIDFSPGERSVVLGNLIRLRNLR